jgi:tetratricopeptide (TPR) repeat protein
MAKIAHVAGDEEGRFAWLDAALQSDRKNGVIASEMALFCMERADYDNALKALQLVTLIKEDAPMGRGEAYLRQAHIAELRGDPRKAALLAKRALTAEPDYQPAKLFLDRLGIA